MTVNRKAVALIAAFMTLTLISYGVAQEKKPIVDVQTGQGNVKVDVNKDNKAVDTRAMLHRVSQIHGMAVMNEAGKELGTVRDVVIDVPKGQIRYAAVAYGGILGVGDKLFAVPWYAFEQRHNASNGHHTLVLNIDEQTLKNAPGFDKSHWPDVADSKFSEEVDKHFLKYRKDTGTGASVEVKKDGNVAVDVKTRPAVDTKDMVKRSSEIVGMTVRGQGDKDIGSINDIMVNMHTGKVRYAALSHGGVLGVGNKLFAVPWSAFHCEKYPNSEKHFMQVNISEDTLKNAPGFDKSHWPDMADPKFGQDVDTYYKTSSK